MSRTRKAAVLAAFSYAQYGLAVGTGIVLIPLVLRHLGGRTYGLWLTTGEVLAYASMVELGMLGVLPWLIAQADGSGNRAAMRTLVSTGLAAAVVFALCFAIAAAVLWTFLPAVLRLTAADRATIGSPLLVVVAATTISYPLRVYRALLVGLQDVVFTGALGVTEAALSAAVTIVMLVKGYGPYALACASATSSILGSITSLVRSSVLAPDLVWQWTRPEVADIRRLFSSGLGAWFGAVGWQVIAASNNVVITYLGHPEWVPIYSCTAKLSTLLTQLGWVLPDSGLIGLAQLHGEQPGSRRLALRIGALLRLHVLLAGAAACGVLAFNPEFVTRWVGPSFFGGVALNGLLAATVVVYSMVHGFMTVTAVLGRRLAVGAATLVNAGLQVAAAIFLGHRLGLHGIALAGLLTALTISVPCGLYLLQSSTAQTVRALVVESLVPWAIRAVPLAGLAALVGIFHESAGIGTSVVMSMAIAAAYAWHMRSLYGVLPLDPQWARWLVALRLVPSASAATSAGPL
jgi:O-antigen/teichoic acid export membrane protein